MCCSVDRYATPPVNAMLPRMHSNPGVCIEKATSTYASNQICTYHKRVMSSDYRYCSQILTQQEPWQRCRR